MSKSKELVRLLICGHCESVQEIPWCGTDKNCGHRSCVEPLEFREAEHTFADGRPHAPAFLADIDKSIWENPDARKMVLSDLPGVTGMPGSGTGLGQTLYDVKNNFTEDAAICWAQHNRTKDCGDYKSDAKRLVPDTRAERKELGIESRSKHIATNTYLCDFCPVKSIVQSKVYSDKFKYNIY